MTPSNAKSLLKLCDPFGRVANIIDSLPSRLDNDETPLRELLPGIWPTLGDLRRLRDEMKKQGWRPR